MNRILVPIGLKKMIIEPDEIIYCEADGRYSKMYLSNQNSILVSKCLKGIELTLKTKSFLRIHHKYLINLIYLREFNINGQGKVLLEGNISLPISVRKKTMVRSFISSYFRK